MRKWLVGILLLVSSLAHAGGRGGSVQAFDPSFFPGATVVCFTSVIAGKCTVAANAICDGNHGTEDQAAVSTWYSLISSSATNVLYIPPGSVCNFPSGFGTVSVYQPVVWGYGAQIVGGAQLGGFQGLYNDSAHSSTIDSVSAGASAVVATAGSDLSWLTVGDYVMVGGVSNQGDGTGSSFPLNLSFCEFKVVTSKSGLNVGLSGALRNSLLSTWPLVDNGTDISPGGPAAIYKLHPEWNTVATYYGLTFRATAQVNIVGRNTIMIDVSFDPTTTDNSPAPSMSEGVWFIRGQIKTSTESDKCMTANYYRINMQGTVYTGFSASDNTLNFTSSYISVLNGIGAKRATFTDTLVGFMVLGPTAFGHGTSIAMDGSYVNTVNPLAGVRVQASSFTYSLGTFTIAKSVSCTLTSCALALVPGQKYYFGDSDCTNNASPTTTFTVTAIRESIPGSTSGNMLIDTDLPGTLPTPVCNGHSCPAYCAYPAATITQINSQAGSADITQYAAP